MALAFPHDVHAVNNKGWTALHAAAYRGAVPVVEALIAARAKLDAKIAKGEGGYGKVTEGGWTPLTVALGYKNGKPLFVGEAHEWAAAAVLYRAMKERGILIDEDEDVLDRALGNRIAHQP